MVVFRGTSTNWQKNINAKIGYEVEVFSPLYVNEYLSANRCFRVRGIKTRPIPFTGNIGRSINTIVSTLILKPRSDVDIFHETYYSRSDSCPKSAKRIVTVYDMIHEKFPQYFPSWDVTRKNKEFAVKRADHIICISENTRRDLIQLLGVLKDKISVIYLGNSLSGESKPKVVDHINKPFLLFVGTRNGHKNFESFLRVFSSSKRLQKDFRLVCFGGGNLSAKEVDLIASLNMRIDDVLQISGDDEMLLELYSSATALIYPSLYEGFGIPPLEAMSVGCPVVCSDAGSIPEVVGDAAEIFNSKSETDMQVAIERVVYSPAYANELIIKGKKRSKIFSWEKCSQDTLDVYEKLLG